MKIILKIGLIILGPGAMAQDEAFFQASLTPDIALQSRDTIVKGLSLNIWGENEQRALTLGFVNGSSGDSRGVSLGLANYAESYTGMQWSFLNLSNDQLLGWQAGVVNVAGEMNGLQTALVNITDTMSGVQLGAFNYTKELQGMQLGLVNIGLDNPYAMSGLQVGAINYVEQLRGLQLGLLNIAVDNPWFSEFPGKLAQGFVFVNWSF